MDMLNQFISRFKRPTSCRRKFVSCVINISNVTRNYGTTMKETPSLCNLEGERPVYDVDIPVPWGNISGKWWGDKDKRPILCIHGWKDNSGSFDTLMNLLVPHNMSFLCIDLPGHGLSSQLPKGINYYLWWEGLTWIRRIAHHFKWDNVSLMGHSLGAYISYMYAGTYPEEVDLLITIDPIIALLFDHTRKWLANDIRTTVDSFLDFENTNNKETTGTYDEMVDILSKAHNGKLPREACELLLKRGMHKIDDNLYKFSRDVRTKPAFLGPPSFSVLEELSDRIKCRFLNIVCVPGFKDLNTYKHVFDPIKEKASYFKLYPIEANHHVHLTNPEKIAPIILECLSSSSSSSSSSSVL